MKVLLLGAHGMLGKDLLAIAPPEYQVTAATRAVADITDAGALRHLMDATGPDLVINAAAYTGVDKAEEDEATAQAVNATAPGELGRLAADRGARVIHYSTDYVFDGQKGSPYQESDRVNPLNVYGATKLAGERALLEACDRAVVLRTQWLFGLGGRSFPRTMADRARTGAATRVVDDQIGRPTSTEDLARVTWHLVDRIATVSDRILHVANAGVTSWYGVARRVFVHFGAEKRLSPCASVDYPTPAVRPKSSLLDTSRLEALLGKPLPPWEDAIDRFLDQLAA